MFAVAVAAAVAYSSWVLEWFLPGGVDPLRSYASELAALTEAEKSAVLVHSLCSSTAAVGMALVGAGCGCSPATAPAACWPECSWHCWPWWP